MATRVASLAKRVGIREEVCMSGGVAQNGGVRNAMAKELGVEIYYDKRAQELGALGAAIYAYRVPLRRTRADIDRTDAASDVRTARIYLSLGNENV